jgi:hypothetical protein
VCFRAGERTARQELHGFHLKTLPKDIFVGRDLGVKPSTILFAVESGIAAFRLEDPLRLSLVMGQQKASP